MVISRLSSEIIYTYIYIYIYNYDIKKFNILLLLFYYYIIIIIIITKYPCVDRYTCNCVNPEYRSFLCKLLQIFQVLQLGRSISCVEAEAGLPV